MASLLMGKNGETRKIKYLQNSGVIVRKFKNEIKSRTKAGLGRVDHMSSLHELKAHSIFVV